MSTRSWSAPLSVLQTSSKSWSAFKAGIARRWRRSSGRSFPDIRREHELRNKQTAFRAMSQLKGVMTDTCLSAVFMHPAADSETIDIVWMFGFLSLTRLRPGVPVKFATRRMADVSSPRRPTNLDGETIHGVTEARLDMFCEAPAEVAVDRQGDVVHYTLGDHGYGPTSAADIVLAEVNLAEMPRYVPEGTSRKGNVFAEVSVPAKRLLFDVFVHADIYHRDGARASVVRTPHSRASRT